MTSNRPNEQTNHGRELRGETPRTPLAEGGEDTERRKSRPSIRWVQLAYDLEQCGDPSPDERGEVF